MRNGFPLKDAGMTVEETMKIKNISQVQQRVEGFGTIGPGEEITVPESVGLSLCTKGSPFKKVSPPRKSNKAESDTARGGKKS